MKLPKSLHALMQINRHFQGELWNGIYESGRRGFSAFTGGAYGLLGSAATPPLQCRLWVIRNLASEGPSRMNGVAQNRGRSGIAR
jgi:hypothetical protein